MDQDRDTAVRQRAYEIWQEEGQPDGRHEQHWAQAEAEYGTADKTSGTRTGPAGDAPGTPPPELENTLA